MSLASLVGKVAPSERGHLRCTQGIKRRLLLLQSLAKRPKYSSDTGCVSQKRLCLLLREIIQSERKEQMRFQFGQGASRHGKELDELRFISRRREH